MDSRKRHKKSFQKRVEDYAISRFTLNKSRPKTILIYLCLFQAIFVFSLGTYVATFHRTLLDDPDPQMVQTRQNEQTFDIDIDGFTNKLSQVAEEIRTLDGESYSFFRFHKYRSGRERPIPKAMMDDKQRFRCFSKTWRQQFLEEEPGWIDQVEKYEEGRFEVYGGRVVYLRNVQVDPSLCTGRAGGENLAEVMNQNVEQEYLTLAKGYFVYQTSKQFSYELPVSVELHKMFAGLAIEEYTQEQAKKKVGIKNKIAIVNLRHEYANFYHSTMNWYDVFLIMAFLKIDPSDVDIIFLDAHPKSALDSVWATLFGQPIRAGAMTKPVTYREMIWNGIGARSQINSHRLNDLPFSEEFRFFMLFRYGVNDNHELKCDKVKVTIIWRKDHVAHPRNPEGFVSRKIANEEEILNGLQGMSHAYEVSGVRLEALSMHEQLEIVSQTDILIGMHGAGLSHILYLPRTSGVIELYPSYFSPSHAHFRSMAKWRRMPYMLWVNGDATKDSPDHKTNVSVSVLKEMVKRMKRTLCERKP